MKKILAATICFVFITAFITVIFSACNDKVIVAKKPIDTRFTAAHDEVIYDGCWIGDYYLPNNYTVFHESKYEVRYLITYEDGSQDNRWLEVDKDEYIRAREKLP